MVVLINAYLGVFTSIMTIPKLEPTIENLDQLAASSKFKLAAPTDLVITKQILVSIPLNITSIVCFSFL